MQVTATNTAFERAFVAISYFLNRRAPDLLEPLAEPSMAAQQLAARLAHSERAQRAHALADELARIVASLDAARAFQ
ncbi:MAG: hypothetical protein ACOY0T_33205 [Myxococcota bacterium]